MTDVLNYTENYDVFLSYRRDGGETMAILLRDRLAAKGYKVFLDVENLNSGSFNKKLLGVIEGCTDVVVICSKGGLDRCINDGDWVRTEVAHAFAHDKNVVPILLRGFEWPDVLPDDIEALRMQNGINANSNEYFDAALDRLAKFLQSSPQGGGEKPGAAKRPGSSAGAGGRAGEQSKPKKPLPGKAKAAIIAAASLVVVAALVLGGIALWGNLGGGGEQDDLQAQSGVDAQASMDVPITEPDTSVGTESGDAPTRTVIQDFEVTYPDGPVTIPDDAIRFTPKGIATIKLKDGTKISAIANTIVFTYDGYVRDGLFIIDNSYLAVFSDMSSFIIQETGGDYKVTLTEISGSEYEYPLVDPSGKLVFMLSDTGQQGKSIYLSDVDSVSFDWTAAPEILDYMLVWTLNGTPMAVPQNMLFSDTLYVSNSGIGSSREIAFSLPLENPPDVTFPQLSQLSVTQQFEVQYGDNGLPWPCYSVEIKLRTGEILKNDIYHSYYGTTLWCVTSLGPTEVYLGNLISIQYIDGM
jgi:hypothetical protein